MLGEQYKTLCLYYTPESAPCRHVMLTAKILGLDLNLIHVDLVKGEHLKRSYLQLNPEHKLPTLTDNLFAISESRAIMTYLVDKYAKNESLYPRDNKKRAKINQFLYFDMYSMLPSISAYYVPVLLGEKNFDQSKLANVEKAFKNLDTFLKDTEYLVGNTLTLADVAVVSSVATIIAVCDFQLRPYGNVDKWYKHLKATATGFDEVIIQNCKILRRVIDFRKNQ